MEDAFMCLPFIEKAPFNQSLTRESSASKNFGNLGIVKQFVIDAKLDVAAMVFNEIAFRIGRVPASVVFDELPRPCDTGFPLRRGDFADAFQPRQTRFVFEL